VHVFQERYRTEYYSQEYPRELRAPAYDDRVHYKREYYEEPSYRVERRPVEYDRYEPPRYAVERYDRPYRQTYRDYEPNYYSKSKRYDYY